MAFECFTHTTSQSPSEAAKDTMSSSVSSTTQSANDVPADANEGCVGPSSEQAGKASGEYMFCRISSLFTNIIFTCDTNRSLLIACDGCPSQGACSTGQFRQNTAAEQEETIRLQTALGNVSNVVLVLSGKGGVGKVCLRHG